MAKLTDAIKALFERKSARVESSEKTRRLKPQLILCLLLFAVPVLAQQAGDTKGGGVAEQDFRFLLPPTDQAEPEWTNAERQRGYVVYAANYCDAMWPRQVPTREQIVDSVGCRLARDEYEPIQIGVFGVGSEQPLRQVKVSVDIDLPAEVRFTKHHERTPTSKLLKHLGPTLVPFQLRLGDTHELIEPGHTGAFWITFHAEVDAKPGEHTGTITISVEGKPDVMLRLTVDVLPMQLPKPDIAFGMYHYRINSTMENEDYAAKIQRDMAAHGTNSSTRYGMNPIRYEQGRLIFPSIETSRLHDWIERGMIRPDIPTMLLDYQLINWLYGRTNDALTDRQKQDIARQYIAFSRAHNFPELLAYMQDEPGLDQPASYFPWVTGWKKTPMRTVTAMSSLAAAAFGHLHDVWVVLASQVTPEMVREAWRQGAEAWTYMIRMGAYNVHSNRYFAGLYTWALALRGNWVWAYYHSDGNYVIFEKEGPDPLVAWEGRREGIDDYRYLMMLDALVDRAADDNETARQAKAWIDELRAGVDLTFFHGIELGQNGEAPFCYPAPKLEIDDYDRIRAKAADFCLRLGADKLKRFAPKPYVRSGAAKWEAQPFERATVEGCIAGLADPDMQLRRAAAASLADRGEAALPAAEALKQLLTDPDVRLVAARALHAIGPQAAGAADAIAVLLDDDDTYVRTIGAMALGGLGEQSVTALRKALRDREPDVINLAGEGLAAVGPAAAPAVPELIEMLDVPHARHGAILAFQGIGPKAAPAVEALTTIFDETGGKYEHAARALGSIGPAAESAIDVLQKHRNVQYWSVAINAALFKIRGDTADLEVLVEFLMKGGYRNLCTEKAAEALDDLGANAAAVAPAVARLLQDKADFFEKHKGPSANVKSFLQKCREAGVSLD